MMTLNRCKMYTKRNKETSNTQFAIVILIEIERCTDIEWYTFRRAMEWYRTKITTVGNCAAAVFQQIQDADLVRFCTACILLTNYLHWGLVNIHNRTVHMLNVNNCASVWNSFSSCHRPSNQKHDFHKTIKKVSEFLLPFSTDFVAILQ